MSQALELMKRMDWLMFCTCKRDIELRDDEKLAHKSATRKVEWKDV